MSTGAGIVSTRSVASARNPSLKPEMGRPSASMSAAPRATLIIPRVAMKGGSRPTVISRPLIRPHASPIASAIAIPTGAGRPLSSASARPIPAKASTDPTDRSMPPEMITNVIPMATMAFRAVCSSTLSRFETVRKCGVAAHRIAHSVSRPANVPS